jgi:hypothetical protein
LYQFKQRNSNQINAGDMMDRNEAIAQIKAALKQRTKMRCSVRGGTGTAWGWITIDVAPSRKIDGKATEEDAAELAQLLGLDHVSRWNGVSVPASTDYRIEYVDRANGREPSRIGQQYWD